MESYLGAPVVRPNIPSFYLHPSDAKIQQELISNLQIQLDLVKRIHSSDMLAYCRTLLDVAMSGNVHWKIQAISRVLKTRPRIIIQASQRRASLKSVGGSQFAIRKRRKKSDVVLAETADKVKDWWWEHETRVNPNRIQIVSLCIAPNFKKTHPTHLFIEM
jgi:hypothetical protein